MNKKYPCLVLLLSLSLSCTATEAQIRGKEDVLAARGKGELTQELFEVRLSRLKPEHRFAFIRNRERMEDTLDKMLLNLQLEADAREDGFQEREDIQARMALAAREELAQAWIEHVIMTADKADFVALAREEYLINKSLFMTPHMVNVSHILISTDDRANEDALALAVDVRQRIIANPESFQDLVREYSDDDSKASNKGSFKDVKRGDMVPAFEEAAFTTAIGSISEPVLTPYGYHIVRKDGETLPVQQSFKEVKPQLVRRATQLHEDRARRDYLGSLYDEEMEVSKESIENAIEYLFGPEILAKYTKGTLDKAD